VARRGAARHGKAWHGKAWQGKAWWGGAQASPQRSSSDFNLRTGFNFPPAYFPRHKKTLDKSIFIVYDVNGGLK